jgi:hypothetical protein
VHDTGEAVAAFAREFEGAIGVAGAAWAECTTWRTTAASATPAPTRSVSARWASTLSSGSCTTAMPPCAHAVLVSSSSPLASSNTSAPASAAASAVQAPAMPLPITSTSVRSSGVVRRSKAASRDGNNGVA